MISRNRNKVLPLALTVAFCAMLFVVSAQKRQTMPSAVLVKNKCVNCIKFDTICQFQYGDVVLTEDSITFRNIKCIHYYDDQDSWRSFLHDTYLIFSFPKGKRYTMELFDWYSSFVPQYAPIIYRRDWGNTLPIQAKFGKDWSKSLQKFVKKWNSYADQEEAVLNIIECGPYYSRTIQIQGKDTLVVLDTKFVVDWPLEPDDSDFMFDSEIVDGDTICRFPEYFPRFPGGIDSLNAFLLRETQYPNDPFLDVTGTVVVQFLVEKDGSVTLPQVIVPLYPDCDKEAFRVIQLMPKWEPATVNGVPVRCFYQVPVRFWR